MILLAYKGIYKPVNLMTVKDRCGQRNELPPVLQSLSANKYVEVLFYLFISR